MQGNTLPRDIEVLELPTNGWPSDWVIFSMRFWKNKPIGVARSTLRKIAKMSVEDDEEKIVTHVNRFNDIFPSESESITHLDFYYSDNGNSVLQSLCLYLRDPILWPNLRHVRILRLKDRPLQRIVIHTPSVTGYIHEFRRECGLKVWDKSLALKRRVLRVYDRRTLFVILPSTMLNVEANETSIGRIILAQRELIESKDGLKYRFIQDDRGHVSGVTLRLGETVTDEIDPIVYYDKYENYRLWTVERVIFIPFSLSDEELFVSACSNIRKMVVSNNDFSVLLVDYFVDSRKGDVRINGKPPPVFESPLVEFADKRIQLFIQKHSLIRAQADPSVSREDRHAGFALAPPSKRVFTWPSGAPSLRREEQEEHVGR